MKPRAGDNRFLVYLDAGQHVFREGEAVDHAYVIESGVVEITHDVDGAAEVLGSVDI